MVETHAHDHGGCGCGHVHERPAGYAVLDAVLRLVFRTMEPADASVLVGKVNSMPLSAQSIGALWPRFAVWLIADEKEGLARYVINKQGASSIALGFMREVAKHYTDGPSDRAEWARLAANTSPAVDAAIEENNVVAGMAAACASGAAMYRVLLADGVPEEDAASQATFAVQSALNVALVTGSVVDRAKAAKQMAEKVLELLGDAELSGSASAG